MLASSSLQQNATGGVWGLHSSCGEFSYSMAGAGPSAEFPEALSSDRAQKFIGTLALSRRLSSLCSVRICLLL